jgi:[ribosomal protein S5]-alanine N-acetyltransferase
VSAPPRPRPVTLVLLPAAAMTALLADDLAAASTAAGHALTDYFLTDRLLWLWRYRLDQLASDPGCAGWLVHLALAPGGVVVGHGGFHGRPDTSGMVEVGYSVHPAHRRQGYGRAILAELMNRALAEPAVTTVRASISPDNAASLATIANHGFVRVGEQWDDRDGLELLFEVPATAGADL